MDSTISVSKLLKQLISGAWREKKRFEECAKTNPIIIVLIIWYMLTFPYTPSFDIRVFDMQLPYVVAAG